MGIGFTENEWNRYVDTHQKENDKKITDFIVGAILMFPAAAGVVLSCIAIIL